MPQSLSYPIEIKQCYHKLVFSSATALDEIEPLWRTAPRTLEDTKITKIADLGELHFSQSAMYRFPIFSIFNNSAAKLQLYVDGSLKLANNVSGGTVKVGAIKNIQGKLYLGVQ